MGLQQKKRSPKQEESPKRGGISHAKLRSGDLLDDRFEIMGRPLGKGGMGTVYRVQDADGIEYAIKRLSPALHEEKRFVTRFQREYDAASSLRHPNIIAYQELFKADGVLHIRMEYNDGINLRQLMRHEKSLSADLATSICRDLARALEHLHTHRVVHRDIKPENVLVGRKGTVKLCDFGISRFEYSTVTRTGTLLGTPRYMSPEQMSGRKGEAIGPASDLYALGVVLYEMLTGKDPYRLPKKADILQVINVKQSQKPRPLPKDFDPELSSLVMKLLEHDPSMRPSSARSVGQQLGRWAMSRRKQKSAFRQTLEELESGGNNSRRLPGPKRKRNSFWDDSPQAEEPDTEVMLPPEPTYPLFPAFILTLLFLVLLWGVGFFQQQRSRTNSRNAKRTIAMPLTSAPPNRTLVMHKNSLAQAKRRRIRRSHRKRSRGRSRIDQRRLRRRSRRRTRRRRRRTRRRRRRTRRRPRRIRRSRRRTRRRRRRTRRRRSRRRYHHSRRKRRNRSRRRKKSRNRWSY